MDGSVRIQLPAGSSPAWRALYDPRQRLVVAANFDTDVGDAWEFADVPYYPEAMTRLEHSPDSPRLTRYGRGANRRFP